LRDEATKTKQKCMDEATQADFRTDAEREECGGVLPRAEDMRVAFLLVEETTAGKHCGEKRSHYFSGRQPARRQKTNWLL
jgi:hypothetical protein